VATDIHSFPEGVAVSVPIYYATGSSARPSAGRSSLILSNNISSTAIAILFGLVGGLMVHMSVRKLMPAALRYDPHDRVSSALVIAGMALMAVSLVIFVAIGFID